MCLLQPQPGATALKNVHQQAQDPRSRPSCVLADRLVSFIRPPLASIEIAVVEQLNPGAQNLRSGLRAARSRRGATYSRSFARRPLIAAVETDPPAVRRFWFDRLWSEIVPHESLLLAGEKKFKPLQVCRLRLERGRIARVDCNKCVCTK